MKGWRIIGRLVAGVSRSLVMASWPVVLFSGIAWAQVAEPLPGAKQIGVACAFYANVPALTKVSGIQIVDETPASKAFVASVYGLRRGDFEFRKAFDKEIFFELFGMVSKSGRRDYDDLPGPGLLAAAEQLITEVFEPAPDRGDFISLRALGPFGGPHNVLLLGHSDGKCQFHDPATGTIRTTSRSGLAAKILSESKQGTKVKKRYYSGYQVVTVSGAPGFKGGPLGLAQLPDSLSVHLTDAQQEALKAKLTGSLALETPDVGQVVKALPAVDFAIIAQTGEGTTKLVSAIDSELPAKSLHGVANLAKLAINSYQIGARDLLPVWWIDHQPCVITGYAKAREAGGTAVMTWFTQGKFEEVGLGEALAKLKASGSLIGHVEVPSEVAAERPASIEENR